MASDVMNFASVFEYRCDLMAIGLNSGDTFSNSEGVDCSGCYYAYCQWRFFFTKGYLDFQVNCAEARPPRTVWRWLALSPALSTRTRRSVWHSRFGHAPSSSAMPEPLHRLKVPSSGLLHSALQPLQTGSDRLTLALCAGFYRAGETRFGL